VRGRANDRRPSHLYDTSKATPLPEPHMPDGNMGRPIVHRPQTINIFPIWYITGRAHARPLSTNGIKHRSNSSLATLPTDRRTEERETRRGHQVIGSRRGRPDRRHPHVSRQTTTVEACSPRFKSACIELHACLHALPTVSIFSSGTSPLTATRQQTRCGEQFVLEGDGRTYDHRYHGIRSRSSLTSPRRYDHGTGNGRQPRRRYFNPQGEHGRAAVGMPVCRSDKV